MPLIPQRTRFFVGCEGDSEYSYALFLQRLANRQGLHVHLHRVNTGGGDPLAMVEEAVSDLRRALQKGKFAGRFMLLDEDRIGADHARDAKMRALAAKAGLDLILQQFDHEAVLLRHFLGHQSKRPPPGHSDAQLRQVWAGYKKPMSADELLQQLTVADLQRAMKVEPDLAAMLKAIGF